LIFLNAWQYFVLFSFLYSFVSVETAVNVTTGADYLEGVSSVYSGISPINADEI
jgi:hypothetical protein